MTRKIAIVGSKSLQGYNSVYEIIDNLLSEEIRLDGPFSLINGGEEGVDLMAAELALSKGVEYELIPLPECTRNCTPGKKYCFEHSYKPRSKRIAEEASKIYRIFDQGCGTSTCEVTARFGDELRKKVTRIPVDILSIVR